MKRKAKEGTGFYARECVTTRAWHSWQYITGVAGLGKFWCNMYIVYCISIAPMLQNPRQNPYTYTVYSCWCYCTFVARLVRAQGFKGIH